jgi:uncharacterized repeat protein (TIGR03843 family)
MEKDVVLDALQNGTMELQGQFLHGSNYTFLVHMTHNGNDFQAVYKPTRGEQPLWDFPEGTLAKREVAAFLVSKVLGWELVPPTVYRHKAPIGPGSLQFYVQHDPRYHYFNFNEEDKQCLRPTVLYDLLVNNADRKGSHVILDDGRHLWLIDHGICFHVDGKLRTVIWDFAGEPFPANLIADLHRLVEQAQPGTNFYQELSRYLRTSEIKALVSRAETQIEDGAYPFPPEQRRAYPWPPV